VDSWKVRDGYEKDVDGILSLRDVVFGTEEQDKLDFRFWRWEFMEGPDGKALIYIVEDGKRMIGHFADIPRRFSLHGKVVCGTLSVDLMVHPDYRRKGIFQAMGKYAIQRVKNEKGLFMISCPIRRETIQGFKKIGWEEVERLPVLAYPIRFSGIANRYLRFPPISLFVGGVVRFFYLLLCGLKKKKEIEGMEIEKVSMLDELFDSFWQKALSLHPILGVRNRNYLTWRYQEHPTRKYTIYRAKRGGEMKGYIVLRKVKLLRFNSAVIVDLLALDEGTLAALLEKGIQYGREEGTDLLGCMLPQGHSYYKTLRERGFFRSFKTFLLMIYPHSDRKIFLAPEKWYVNWGDTDVI
jgi:GNAT superfamily N-acetyltransferase